LRDLDSINCAAKSTRFIFAISLIIPLVMGCGAWALAVGAAPKQALHENYLGLLGLGIASVAIIAFPIPYIFHWNWETKYFGTGMLSLSSASILGIYPILCIAQYSSLPIFARLTFVGLECILIIRWCRRFANIYRIIYSKKELFNCIYIEESSAVYYSQQADKQVIEKLLKFEQFPHSKYFILSGLTAFSLTPFATSLSKLIGVPFVHVFLAIFSIPLNLMFLGLTTRGWLVFYFYPMKIKRKTNKPIYVDISSRPPECLTSLRIHKNNV
jgi:hypothetical protein